MTTSPYRAKRRQSAIEEVFVDLIPLLNRLVDGPAAIRVEKRQKTYGVRNYGEIIGVLNPSDGDLWDVFLPGYEGPLDRSSLYTVDRVHGVLLTPNGNHKIAVSVKESPADCARLDSDIETFCEEYARSHRFTCKWVGITQFNSSFLSTLFHAYRNNGTWGRRRTKIFA